MTRNIMEWAPAHTVLRNQASVPEEDRQPFLYLGVPSLWLPDPLVEQVGGCGRGRGLGVPPWPHHGAGEFLGGRGADGVPACARGSWTTALRPHPHPHPL